MVNTLLLFDIDGTLLLTGACGKIALEEAFEEMFNIPGCWGDTAPHGKTDPAIIDAVCLRLLGRLLTPEENVRLTDRYHYYFRRRIANADKYRLMPGVPQLLDFLSRKNDVLLALGTGNFEKAAWMKLERGNIHHYFKCGGFGSDSAERPEILEHAIRRAEKITGRPIPKNRIHVIGDTEYDIAAAKKAGLRSIAVLTNGRTPKDFEPDPPDHILPDLSDILAFISCLK